MPRRNRKVSTPERVIGARLSELRKRRAKTQVQLAQQLGMSQSLLSRYERGDVRLHGALVADFARALGVSADEILGLKDLKGNGLFADRRFVRRLQQIEKLSKRKKQALLTTLDDFLRGAGAAD